MISISLSEKTAYVLTGRNEVRTEFYIRPKDDLVKEIKKGEGGFVVSFLNEGVISKNQIIEMMDDGVLFFTYSNNTFTSVIVVKGYLRSVPNASLEDNIENLPVIIVGIED